MLESFLQEIPAAALGRAQELDLDIPYESCNEEINSLLGRTVLLGGKRLRPLLTFLIGKIFKPNELVLDTCAQSIEMVHAASLAHDDVVDNASMRRGRKSINATSSNKQAVLAGDYLLASVITNLAEHGNAALVKEMSKVIMDLAEGEWIQLEAIEKRNYTEALITDIAIKKTSSVMSWCAVAPAILTEQSDEVLALAREFGVHLGLGFQLMDDTLDFNESSEKDAMLDLDNGILSAVYFEWLSSRKDLFGRFRNGEDLKSLYTGESIEDSIEVIKKKAHYHLDKAESYLGDMVRKANLTISEEELSRDLKPIKFILNFIGRRTF